MIFVIHTRLHGTLQIMLQIEVLFTVQKLARFRKSLVNERRNRASFSPFKNLSGPEKTGSQTTIFAQTNCTGEVK